MSKHFLFFLLLLLFSGLISCKRFAPSENKENNGILCPQLVFALNEINKESKEIGKSVRVSFNEDSKMEPQSFRIKQKGIRRYTISGGDTTGLMYGGMELAEMIRLDKKLPEIKEDIFHKPYIKRRGLKFNIPLDIRTPSYQDAGDAAQNNILEMWNFEFWREYLDMMARNRYNVLTLWNPHPFPSMIKMEEYPDIALDNVCGTSFPLDTDRRDEPLAEFIAGCGVSQKVIDELVVLKEISIEEKISFWRRVMKYARERGVDVYFITWNIKLNSIAPPGWYREQNLKMESRGKYGINNDQENPSTIKYLRKAVKQFILTYPDLKGIGTTAGENMEDRDDEYDREKWLWKTYGMGVIDAKKEQADRKIEFIHRYWQSGIGTINDEFFSKYPDEINLSFKYARARMYATPNPQWANDYIREYSEYNLKSWWNIRNDDIFHFRWGDPEYASEFIKNIPEERYTAGYFMGSDGYVWGREFISKNPTSPRELEINKHWYNFMLWGRMGYNPELSTDRILKMIAIHYPQLNPKELANAWKTASRIPSLVTNFHWNNWDFQWAVEGCLDLRNGFHTVERFINNPTREGSNILSIPEYFENLSENNALSPFEISDKLDSMAIIVLRYIQSLPDQHFNPKTTELINDLKAWAFMGKYYASKIRGSVYFYAYKKEGLAGDKQHALMQLKDALKNWEKYADAASSNYNPQFMAKTRVIDWHELTKEVQKDYEYVQSCIF